jgi:hypothetical protein
LPTAAQTYKDPGSITRVKNRSVGHVEYVIFDVKKPEDGATPEYKVKSAKPPFTDYSGEETFGIRGSRNKGIVFKPIFGCVRRVTGFGFRRPLSKESSCFGF